MLFRSAEAWSGILAPAGTPKEIVARLNATIAKIVRSADYRALLEGRMVDPVGSSVEQFAARIQDDVAKWQKVVRQAGIKTE